MPTVGVYADSLCKRLKIDYDANNTDPAEKIFDELCFQYGLELDEVTNDFEAWGKERGVDDAKAQLAKLKAEDADKARNFERTQWKIDIPANRYDLLCEEGLVRALGIFENYPEQKAPVYKVNIPEKPLQCFIKKEVAEVRPYFMMAVLRNINFTKDSYNSFIDLQDKLHQNICRKRSLVSMGTHDLDEHQKS